MAIVNYSDRLLKRKFSICQKDQRGCLERYKQYTTVHIKVFQIQERSEEDILILSQIYIVEFIFDLSAI